MTDIEEIKKQVEKELSTGRYLHTIGVTEEAVRLAERWGADPNSAYIAALVHDYAKEIPRKRAMEMLRELMCDVADELEEYPNLVHGPLAAYMLERDFGIHDGDILSAVRYHTTGRRGMSLLEKIIYIADFIEPNRCFEGVECVRGLAYEDLDRAILCEADMVIKFTIDRGGLLHRNTVETRNEMLIKTKEGKQYEG